MNPVIIEKTKNGEVHYDIYSRLIKDRIIFLNEEINADVASIIVATLLYLNLKNSDESISIYINSPGGTVTNGLFTIYDTIQRIEAPVETVCVGEAYSAAAVILAAGEKGKRKAYPNSKIMIHNIQVSGIWGDSKDIEREARLITNENKKLLEVLARHSGNTLKKITKDCTNDFYMSAEEAKKYGIIDEILLPKKEIPDLVLK